MFDVSVVNVFVSSLNIHKLSLKSTHVELSGRQVNDYSQITCAYSKHQLLELIKLGPKRSARGATHRRRTVDQH